MLNCHQSILVIIKHSFEEEIVYEAIYFVLVGLFHGSLDLISIKLQSFAFSGNLDFAIAEFMFQAGFDKIIKIIWQRDLTDNRSKHRVNFDLWYIFWLMQIAISSAMIINILSFFYLCSDSMITGTTCYQSVECEASP